MTYTKLGPRALDYTLCQYGVSRNIFRGPRKSFCKPYIVCLGGSETFGQSVPAPFPILTERLIGQTVVNLGVTHAGPDLYLKDDAVIDIARKAELCVLQVMGANNMSNPYYKVHPRRNDRFIKALPALGELFPEVDFTEFHYTKHLLHHLNLMDCGRFQLISTALRKTWCDKMKRLLKVINRPTVLLWMQNEPASFSFDSDPLFVTEREISSLSSQVLSISNYRRCSTPTAYSKYQFSDTLDQDCHAEISMRLATDILVHVA